MAAAPACTLPAHFRLFQAVLITLGSQALTAAEQTSKPIRAQVAALEEGRVSLLAYKKKKMLICDDYTLVNHLHCRDGSRVSVFMTEDWKSIRSVVGCHV